jgi:hypothetical protein
MSCEIARISYPIKNGAYQMVPKNELSTAPYRAIRDELRDLTRYSFFSRYMGNIPDQEVWLSLTKQGLILENKMGSRCISLQELPSSIKTDKIFREVERLNQGEADAAIYAMTTGKKTSPSQLPECFRNGNGKNDIALNIMSFIDVNDPSFESIRSLNQKPLSIEELKLSAFYEQLGCIEEINDEQMNEHLTVLRALLGHEDVSFEDILFNCKNLKKLDLNYGNVNRKQLQVIKNNCPNLESVSFRSDYLTDDDLALLSNYKHVSLAWSDKITNAGLASLQNCESVSLKGFRQITNNGLSFLKKCKSVELSSCSQITDSGLANLCNCERVGCHALPITNAGLKHLENCKIVSVSACFEITDIGLIHLRKCNTVNLYRMGMSGMEIQNALPGFSVSHEFIAPPDWVYYTCSRSL